MIAWFARHPTAANLLMAAIMILGLVTLPNLQRETFPEIANDRVEVRVVYKGATTAEVEDAICRRIEDGLDGITDLDETRCEAREGIGIATAVMREGAGMARFLDDVNAAIDAIDDFPDDAERPVIAELGRTDAVVSVAITGPDDPVALRAYADDVKSRLQQLRSISTVTITGFSAHQLRIEIPLATLRRHGLSTSDIARTIGQQSVGLPAGELQGPDEDVLLRFDDQRKTVADLEDLVVVASRSGAAIRLGDIATIVDRFERDEEKVLFNGHRAAILDVTKTRAQDTLTAYRDVAAFVEAERARAPAGVTLALTQDRSSIVADRLDMLVRNGIQGLFFVFLILWLFFGFRYSFWVAMGLPVSFLGALFLLPAFGVTINMISMVGLLIGVGLLMDDAIVIAENVAARMARGDRPLDAAINGATQVMPGVLSSFATTVLVFGSLAFITGEIGQVLRVVPIVLILVILISLIEAFLILPSHLGHSLMHARERPPGRFRAAFERGFAALRDRHVLGLLDRAIAHRYLTVGLFVMLLLFAIAMPVGGLLKFTGFPDIEGDVVEARLLLPQGTPLARTEAIVATLQREALAINDELRERQPGGQDLVRNITVIHGQNPDAFETGPHVARVIVDLLGAEQRATALDDFRNRWRERVGRPTDVIALKFTEPVAGPGGLAIDIRLIGDDLDEVKQAALDLRGWLGRYDGVIDLSDDLRPGKREYRLTLKDGASALGLTADAVATQVRAAMQGFKVDEFPLGAETYEVDVRVDAGDRRDRADLESLTIVGPEGQLIPLPVVVDIEEARGWARINRIDGRRAVTVQGDVDRAQANAQELLNLAAGDIFPELRERYPTLKIDIQGASDRSARTGSSIARNVLLGMIGVYMLLALQFRGYVAPLTVMTVIPAALIGVVFGHMALGLDLTLPSIIGMASLFGVVVNDAILLVVFIREERASGVSVPQAARDAAVARFRPILLTSVTTIAGLTPLLLESSLQAQILVPLAASLAFGLLSATLVALFLVPAIYCILDDFDLLGEVETAPR
jgi:hydrophobic/amphiphilic exporter-1 (mainly G- bacteria), HAE1 family